jgi:hypothetical protein
MAFTPPYDPESLIKRPWNITSADRIQDILERLQDRIGILESREAERTGANLPVDAPKFNPEKYTISLGRPSTVIHRLGNGLLVTDLGEHDGQVMNNMFFASPLDFANHLIAVAAKKELEK